MSDSNSTLFVRNLSYEATADDVRQIFSKVANVVSVRCPASPEDPKKNRGFAFVVFNSPAEAHQALTDLNQKPGPKDRIMHVRFSEDRPQTRQ